MFNFYGFNRTSINTFYVDIAQPVGPGIGGGVGEQIA